MKAFEEWLERNYSESEEGMEVLRDLYSDPFTAGWQAALRRASEICRERASDEHVIGWNDACKQCASLIDREAEGGGNG